jgi:hypothetical protein
VLVLDRSGFAETLGELLDKPVTLEPARSVTDPVAVATYTYDDGSVAAAVGCDLAFALRCAGALMMVPPERVEEALAAGVLDDGMADNLREVLNVLSSLFNRDGLPHARLASVTTTAPHGAGSALLSGGGVSFAFDVTIATYGVGRAQLVTAVDGVAVAA